MKTQELEKTKENGVAEKATKENTQDIVLTTKQKEMLTGIMEEKRQLQVLAEEVVKREILISSLIMDGAGIDEEKIASAQLNEDGSILTVTKKE